MNSRAGFASKTGRGVMVVFFVLGLARGVFAWARHDFITATVVAGLPWLEEYRQLPVTPCTYPDATLNPAYQPPFINPDYKATEPQPGKYQHYDLVDEAYYGLRGVAVNGRMDAKDILVQFCNEPDWGLDDNLEAGLAGRWMAGSHGFRHMYYPALTWHLPWLFFGQGVPHQRIEHFWRLSTRAFQRGDMYWGFRFLARCLHYIQDVTQPFHTTQTSLKYIVWSSPLAGTTQATKNYHFAFESYVAWRLQGELAGLWAEDYLRVLRQYRTTRLEKLLGKEELGDGLGDMLLAVARWNSQRAQRMLDLCRRFFGDGLRTKEKIVLTDEEVRKLANNPYREQFEAEVRRALALAASSTYQVLEYLRQSKYITPQASTSLPRPGCGSKSSSR